AYNYIIKDSFQNGQIVRDEILALTINLVNHPEKYPLDRFKKNNDGSFRAFEIHHYRISYRILKSQIIIVRLRHTSMSPLLY
ncbi:MAG: type II toxin-antitoxin system RelE/ParE family toxin, partial [Bacteroidota bacterium]|nr:type II toxin-antitoxin system RelE/ParE family toxin [Bacteroidota bacterium]